MELKTMAKEKTKKKEFKDAEQITKEMGIMEIIEKKPQSGAVMMEYGMHCIGCMASQFETLEQGCMAHGMTEKQIDEMVEKINKMK
jgi:hybrid cluster-associated redox disulfide protein